MFTQRRQKLIEQIKTTHKTNSGLILLLSNFEHENSPFRQESTFWYYTGCNEPASALIIDLSKNTHTLFVPETGTIRAKWVPAPITPGDQHHTQKLGVHEIAPAGEKISGYSVSALYHHSTYKNLILELKNVCEKNTPIFSCYPQMGSRYTHQVHFLNRLSPVIPVLHKNLTDISQLISAQRAIKEPEELALMRQARELTTHILENINKTLIKPNITEAQIRAHICHEIFAHNHELAFDPIIASGPNTCFAHYKTGTRTLNPGDPVLIDCGARIDNYCADITRMYCVSTNFLPEQQEIFDIVSRTQEFIAQHAQPGFYVSNPEFPEKSLNHLMLKFFEEQKLSHGVVHGIGHFLGLDVHDVGNYTTPLQENMVITIEPGLYFPDKKFGMRLEDDFVITKTGAQKL